MATAKENQVQVRKSTAVAAVPAYINQGIGRGSEDVGIEDIVIPRIELVQALSPCLKPSDAQYIEGAKVGMLFNSVTRELYGTSVNVVPVLFRKEFLCWRNRKKGGGFAGAYPTLDEANARIKEEQNPEEWEANEHAQQIVLVLKDGGRTEECVVSMSRTKLKVSKQWNSLIRINGGDRFSRVYTLFGVEATNANNESYYNYGVANAGFPDEPTYKKSIALYNSIKSGDRSVVLDVGDGNEEVGSSDF